MSFRKVQNLLLIASIFLLGFTTHQFATENKKNSEGNFYQYGERTRDGIGKYYMGREISQVMGHLGAGWLERPKREQEERTADRRRQEEGRACVREPDPIQALEHADQITGLCREGVEVHQGEVHA